MEPPRALIFDVDGTLAETEELHRRAFNETFTEAGLDWSWDRPLYKELLKTTGGKERIDTYQRDYLGGSRFLTSNSITTLHKAKTARYIALMRTDALSLRPGVDALISEAREAGLGLAIATTTSHENIDVLCQCCWSKPPVEVFDVIAAGDEVKEKKPAPDIFHLVLDQFSLPSSACIAFEDSRNGLLSANAAGLRTVITPGMYTEDQNFDDAFTVLPEMPSLKQLTRALQISPLG